MPAGLSDHIGQPRRAFLFLITLLCPALRPEEILRAMRGKCFCIRIGFNAGVVKQCCEVPVQLKSPVSLLCPSYAISKRTPL